MRAQFLSTALGEYFSSDEEFIATLSSALDLLIWWKPELGVDCRVKRPVPDVPDLLGFALWPGVALFRLEVVVDVVVLPG